MNAFSFQELLTLCESIRRRSDEGDRPPEIVGHSPAQVHDLLASLYEAGAALQRMGYILLAGGRIALSVLSEAEAEEAESRGLSELPAGARS